MFIFPLVYIVAFLVTIRNFWKGKMQTFFVFLIFGLSIYMNAMSVTFKMGFADEIPLLQSFKEVFVLLFLGWNIYHFEGKLKIDFIDKAIIAYFLLTLLYALLPLAGMSFTERLVSFKSTSFFVLVYFAGRLYPFDKIEMKRFFLYILVLAVIAGAVVLIEAITYQHLQTLTGYADYNFYYFNFEPSGHFGLSWTFESAGGFKRFGSIFANPLEHAAATLIALSVLAAFYTSEDYHFKPDTFGMFALFATLVSITFAFSRSSLVSYFLLIYAYGWITKKKYINKTIHFLVIVGLSYFLYILIKGLYENNGLLEVIVNTFNFTDPSSIGHVVEWMQGLTAIYQHPLGLGLGTSGRIGGSLGENVGGENQFIIIGVQVGIIGLMLYFGIFIQLIKKSKYWYYRLSGKEKMLCLVIFLMKIAFIIPMLTSEVDTSSYISYMTWFLTGIFINMIANKETIYGSEVSNSH
ncbi:MAG: hypothetical protein IE931_00130 [Sphingobacteriales bacterium]|nr:hypothetical protein [Sphingobacteriales bacterium]